MEKLSKHEILKQKKVLKIKSGKNENKTNNNANLSTSKELMGLIGSYKYKELKIRNF